MVLPQHEALLCLLIVRCVQTWHLEAPRAEQMLCQAGSHPLCPDPCDGRGSSEPGQGEKKAHQPLSRAAGVQQWWSSTGQHLPALTAALPQAAGGCPGVGWDPGAVQGT